MRTPGINFTYENSYFEDISIFVFYKQFLFDKIVEADVSSHAFLSNERTKYKYSVQCELNYTL